MLVLPVALALWAGGAASAVHVPPLHSVIWGGALLVFGMATVLAAMASLWFRGGGLPMNAFPPPRLVSSGLYALVPHPIYGGFVIGCAGASIFSGSAMGLWLVTPCVALACSALVLGYELPDLRRRFGAPVSSVWLPRPTPAPPTFIERLRIYPVILLPWLAGFELIGFLGKPPDAISTYLRFESRIPVIEPTELVYASTYLVVLLAPLFLSSAQALHRFAVRGLAAMALIFPLYLLLPFYVPPRPFHSSTAFSPLLLWERTPISGIGAFPSYHVVWALIAASALAEGKRWNSILWTAWAVLVLVSCVTTGMHSIADVLAGIATYTLIANLPAIWAAILHVAERIANSWREVRFGPVRIINHGGYAAIAAFAGMIIIATVLGPGRAALAFTIFLCSVVGAALWAQWVEGSPSLLRPLGFYGGMLGAALGAVVAVIFGINLWMAFAAVCVAAPWIQAIGRLRCLVQGCCHGRPADLVQGIRYTHARSRVCRLTEFAGIPVHATPVYSILCNVAIGAALLRLVQLHLSSAFICGIYLLLSGFGRFVEEAYRGEPQTRIWAGLHLYQWIAIATVIAGAAITCVQRSPQLEVSAPRAASLLLALACGLLAWFVTGVDFPESSRRFARLT